MEQEISIKDIRESEAGAALVLCIVSFIGLLAMFAFCFEGFLLIRDGLQLRTDVRSSAYAEAVGQIVAMDTGVASTHSASGVYASTKSNQAFGGGVSVTAGLNNWQIDGSGMSHQLSGLQVFMRNSASATSLPMSKSSRVDYDQSATNGAGLFSIFVVN